MPDVVLIEGETPAGPFRDDGITVLEHQFFVIEFREPGHVLEIDGVADAHEFADVADALQATGRISTAVTFMA